MEKVLIVVRGGIADVLATTSSVEVIIVDYDGLQVGEGLSVARPHSQIWTTHEIEEYTQREEDKYEEVGDGF